LWEGFVENKNFELTFYNVSHKKRATCYTIQVEIGRNTQQFTYLMA